MYMLQSSEKNSNFHKKFTFSERVLTDVIFIHEKFFKIVSIVSVGVRNAVAYVDEYPVRIWVYVGPMTCEKYSLKSKNFGRKL